MCGILGIARTLLAPTDEAAVQKALDQLDHRGPDARSSEVLSGSRMECVLGHTRLRIIDLSPEADQPLPNEDRTVWVAYNGELYDGVEARRGLEAGGHRFRSRADTEILVHRYEDHAQDPVSMLDGLRGMFAFAIVDTNRDRVFLARDRLGIKPMYWAEIPGGIAFASEVGALTAAGVVHEHVDPALLGEFLLWGHTRTDHAFVPGVRELPAGHVLLWEGGTCTVRRWWQPVLEPRADVGEEAERLLRAVLDDSVRRQLVADRPVGVFLSGGVDSGAVATRAAAAGDVRTFTASFPEAQEDEGPVAAAVAARLGVAHSDVPVTGEEVGEAMPDILAAMDRPTADGVNTWLVCRAAHQAGLVVALSGLGGDELFGGYPSFQQVPRVASIRNALSPLGRTIRASAADAAARRSPGGRLGRLLGGAGGLSGAYASVRCQFSPAELHAAGFVGPLGTSVAGDDPTRCVGDRVTLMELSNYMPEQLLRDTDQMSMSHSLEVRVPLLDDAVVRVALAIPADVRLEPGKQLLARAAGVSRTRKRPFSLPFDTWMRGPLRTYVRDGLLSSELPFADEIPSAFRRNLWSAFEDRRTHWSRPWAVALIRLWAAQRAAPAG
jgi:asparagine synthase (glutamine-hydrolysing)